MKNIFNRNEIANLFFMCIYKLKLVIIIFLTNLLFLALPASNNSEATISKYNQIEIAKFSEVLRTTAAKNLGSLCYGDRKVNISLSKALSDINMGMRLNASKALEREYEMRKIYRWLEFRWLDHLMLSLLEYFFLFGLIIIALIVPIFIFGLLILKMPEGRYLFSFMSRFIIVWLIVFVFGMVLFELFNKSILVLVLMFLPTMIIFFLLFHLGYVRKKLYLAYLFSLFYKPLFCQHTRLLLVINAMDRDFAKNLFFKLNTLKNKRLILKKMYRAFKDSDNVNLIFLEILNNLAEYYSDAGNQNEKNKIIQYILSYEKNTKLPEEEIYRIGKILKFHDEYLPAMKIGFRLKNLYFVESIVKSMKKRGFIKEEKEYVYKKLKEYEEFAVDIWELENFLEIYRVMEDEENINRLTNRIKHKRGVEAQRKKEQKERREMLQQKRLQLEQDQTTSVYICRNCGRGNVYWVHNPAGIIMNWNPKMKRAIGTTEYGHLYCPDCGWSSG